MASCGNTSRVFPSEFIVFHKLSTVCETLNLKLITRLVRVVLFYSAGDFSDLVIYRSTFFHEICDFFIRIHHSGVVSIAEELANFRKRQARHFAA